MIQLFRQVRLFNFLSSARVSFFIALQVFDSVTKQPLLCLFPPFTLSIQQARLIRGTEVDLGVSGFLATELCQLHAAVLWSACSVRGT
ncbi:hypothetical protein CRENBAI_006211 [Crenichthys baileyi]|uniref:Secreted protein n=1 Tax=Crenichthys baileyi TaxID=28760 RepID=A0AAV9RYZ5_9TELE